MLVTVRRSKTMGPHLAEVGKSYIDSTRIADHGIQHPSSSS